MLEAVKKGFTYVIDFLKANKTMAIIIIAAVALVLIAVIAIICKASKNSKAKKKAKNFLFLGTKGFISNNIKILSIDYI